MAWCYDNRTLVVNDSWGAVELAIIHLTYFSGPVEASLPLVYLGGVVASKVFTSEIRGAYVMTFLLLLLLIKMFPC